MSKRWEEQHPQNESDLARENLALRAQVLNLMGKLEVTSNFIPRALAELASIHTLEFEETNAGAWVRRKITHHMGS